MRRKLVLLPGLDGTGLLFDAFITALGPDFAALPVAYPASEQLGYGALADRLRSGLPSDEPYVILAESFSGPLAVTLAADRPTGLRGLILCASFARNPRRLLAPWAGLASLVPVRSSAASAAAAKLLFGKAATRDRRSALSQALSAVAPAVLAHRVAEVARVDVTAHLPDIAVPLLYLQATEDRLVPPAAGKLIAELAPQTEMVRIAGPHALLQAVPQSCAEAVADFAHRV